MKKLLTAGILFAFVTISANAQAPGAAQPKAQPQPQPQAQPAAPKTDEKGAKRAGDSSAKSIALDVKLLGGLGIPLDALSATGSNLGGGGQLLAELRLPFMLGPLEVKAGISAGFYGLGFPSELSNLQASISLVPIMAYGYIVYPIKPVGINPFLGIGGGGTVAAYNISGVSTPLTANSFDGTLGIHLGAEYVLPPLPQLSIVLNLGYLIIFEVDQAGQPNNGQLLTIEVGASYRILGKR